MTLDERVALLEQQVAGIDMQCGYVALHILDRLDRQARILDLLTQRLVGLERAMEAYARGHVIAIDAKPETVH